MASLDKLDTSVVLRIVGVFGLIFLVAPLVLVVPISFAGESILSFPPQQWSFGAYERLFSNSAWYIPVGRSFLIATLSSFISTTIGLIGAYSLFLVSKRYRTLIIGLLLLPLLLPPVVIGVGQLFFFARLGLVDTIPGLVFSHILLSMPFALLICCAGLGRADLHLEDVACSFGAIRLYAFIRVTLPQIWSALGASLLLTFVISFDEPVIAMFLAPSNAKTLPRKLFDCIRYDLDPVAAAVAVLLMLLSIFVGLVIIKRMSRVTILNTGIK